MAYGAEPAGADPLAHTIYIWPSRDLIARSWQWPASWHHAYEHAAGRLGLAVAFCVLDRLPLGERQATLRLSLGCVRFGIRRRSASIYVDVLDFTGPGSPEPDHPGPGGSRQQPCSADGLALGLRGSDRYFSLVVFHGYMPELPAENILPVKIGRTMNRGSSDGNTMLGSRRAINPKFSAWPLTLNKNDRPAESARSGTGLPGEIGDDGQVSQTSATQKPGDFGEPRPALSDEVQSTLVTTAGILIDRTALMSKYFSGGRIPGERPLQLPALLLRRLRSSYLH